jgi:choline dehydrogenase
MAPDAASTDEAAPARLRPDREPLRDEIAPHYDFIVCGGGTAGCVIARRLSDDSDVSVLLLEAGGSDRVPAVLDTTLWMSNIGSERDWGYSAEPSPHLAGRAARLPMGKVLGGGSSINGSIWARGHRHDFDEWARISGDPGWRYDAMLALYRDIEDWRGPPDSLRRGTGGLLTVQLPQDPVPLVHALVEATSALGIPHVADINGAAMEGDGGCGLANMLVRDGNERVSMAATYLRPVMHRPNLHVLLCAEVTRIRFEGTRATGVEFRQRGRHHRVDAGLEVVLSLGAINTPKLLMLSGVGERAHLRSFGLDVVQHLPGVGQNFQDHILMAGCCWEYASPEPPRNNAAEFVFYTKSRADLPAPDLMPVLEEAPFASDEVALQFDVPRGPASAWTLAPGLAQPTSRGQVRLTSANALDPPRIEANFLSTDEDLRALLHCVALCREIGNAPVCAPFRQREVFPGRLQGAALERFVRQAAGTYFHESCTAAMGTCDASVVDGSLRVHGLLGLRIADASVMPTIARGNTMAPTVVIAERAARLMRVAHRLAS